MTSTRRNGQLTRALRILHTLSDGRWYQKWKLAHELGVHPRTIARDLAALTDSGFVVIEADVDDQQRNTGRYRLMNQRNVPHPLRKDIPA